MWGIDMVFVVGGNGGNAGANAIQQECEHQGVVCSVVGIPKSIDNDILLVRCSSAVAGQHAPTHVSMPTRTCWLSQQLCRPRDSNLRSEQLLDL